jgi:replication factor A1
VDILAILKEIGEATSITTKTTQKQLVKREILLFDMSESSIRLTMWGSDAENFAGRVGDVMAIKGAKVSDYNGRTLSIGASSASFELNPPSNDPQVQSLSNWLRQGRGIDGIQLTNLSTGGSYTAPSKGEERKTIAELRDERLGMGEHPDYATVVGHISFVKTDQAISYMACPAEGCGKKVIEKGPNLWSCAACDRDYDQCNHRYIMSIQIADHTDHTWVQMFNETGIQVMERPAEDLHYLKIQGSEEYEAAIKSIIYKEYIFRLRLKHEIYNGESKIRISVLSAIPLDYAKEAQLLAAKFSIL